MKKNNLYFILFIITFSFSRNLNQNFEASTFYNKDSRTLINVLESNISSTTLEIIVDNYNLIEIVDGKFLVDIEKGVPSLDKGKPNLPSLNTSIIIPDQANMKISILDVDYKEYQDIHILPSKGNILRNVNPDTVPFIYGDIYKKNSF